MSRYIASAVAILCVSCLASICIAQDNSAPAAGDAGATTIVVTPPPPPATRLETMLLKKGAVLVRGYTDIGAQTGDDSSTVRIVAVELTDTTHSAKEYGLAIEVGRGDRRSVSYLDYDDIDPLCNALDALTKFDNTATHLASYDAVYHCRGGLDFNSYIDNGSRMVAVRAIQYLAPSGQLLITTAHLRLAALPDLAHQIADAKGALDKAKAGGD